MLPEGPPCGSTALNANPAPVRQGYKCTPDELQQERAKQKAVLPLKYLGALASSDGWSGGAKVLGKLPVPGRPTNLDYSRARAYCACSRCGWGLFGHFFSHLSFLYSFSLSLGDGPI